MGSDAANTNQFKPFFCAHDDGCVKPAKQRQNDLLKNAKASLAQAETHYAKFKNITPLPEMAEASGNVEEKYQQYHAALAELVQFLESGNMDAYFAQPTQGMQNALGEALGKYASVSESFTFRHLIKARGITISPNGSLACWPWCWC